LIWPKTNNVYSLVIRFIWHSQAPAWFFVDKDGKDVSREVLIERMKNHITTVVGRYKGRVHGWDVVNEAIEDERFFQKSKILSDYSVKILSAGF